MTDKATLTVFSNASSPCTDVDCGDLCERVAMREKKKRKGRKEKRTKYEQEMQLSIGFTFTKSHVGALSRILIITDIFLYSPTFLATRLKVEREIFGETYFMNLK